MSAKVLIIGFVWPEPNSSAAGARMMQLMMLFKQQNHEVHFATTASETSHMVNLEEFEIQTKQIQLNNDSFDEYVINLQPDIVLFDRFMIEEQFGWRVAESCPNAIRILDTEDLHSLRKTRQEAFKKQVEFTEEMLLTSEIAKRELASIYRCDLSLIISAYEIQMLQEVFKVDESLLCYLPFLIDEIVDNTFSEFPSFEYRSNFMCIGNFRHEPNWNMVLYLKQSIWPLIRKELPKVELHVFGSYPSEKVTQLNNDREGFIVKGWVDDVDSVMQESRVCLAPIRFGAGIKGKFTDAMQNGLPSVTTSIGAEGMSHNLPWGGYVTDNPKEIASKAINLYKSEKLWILAQQNGAKIIASIYSTKKYKENFIKQIELLSNSLVLHRSSNFIGAMLMHHTLKSTKYLSKWIGEKEKNK